MYTNTGPVTARADLTRKRRGFVPSKIAVIRHNRTDFLSTVNSSKRVLTVRRSRACLLYRGCVVVVPLVAFPPRAAAAASLSPLQCKCMTDTLKLICRYVLLNNTTTEI